MQDNEVVIGIVGVVCFFFFSVNYFGLVFYQVIFIIDGNVLVFDGFVSYLVQGIVGEVIVDLIVVIVGEIVIFVVGIVFGIIGVLFIQELVQGIVGVGGDLYISIYFLGQVVIIVVGVLGGKVFGICFRSEMVV